MSVEGTWNVVIATPIGKQHAVLRLFTEDGALRGVATGEAEEVPLSDLTLQADRLTWRQSITQPMRLNLAFDVAVHGDELTGSAKAGRLPSTKVTGQRAADA
ncbi:hypothetical protein HRW18_12250 [Streptomyces lunaelactis]|uniref:hypothetical protein n=1 Tax=Streptomyces lunaelactis TaxID=1535768 RepID=UPI001584DD27|nr:hypothetical protein [Streptomyces lunaelactis]NUK08770.1 hypothetical protein [Streptomyces lunaelactis]NUK49963.1 hypothetical protein [Streptomyces lunaelactis]NUK55799.1 hypothetical protein [Streptomyces lunaelactis]NUK64223.1 hypothetical protein [Streptomyces lunaelactis]NUL09764.1 hypothetical protein [Streptomyces lunaelactis]